MQNQKKQNFLEIIKRGTPMSSKKSTVSNKVQQTEITQENIQKNINPNQTPKIPIKQSQSTSNKQTKLSSQKKNSSSQKKENIIDLNSLFPQKIVEKQGDSISDMIQQRRNNKVPLAYKNLFNNSKIFKDEENVVFKPDFVTQFKLKGLIKYSIIFLSIFLAILIPYSFLYYENKFCNNNLLYYTDKNQVKIFGCNECPLHSFCKNGKMECISPFKKYGYTCKEDQIINFYVDDFFQKLSYQLQYQKGESECDHKIQSFVTENNVSQLINDYCQSQKKQDKNLQASQLKQKLEFVHNSPNQLAKFNLKKTLDKIYSLKSSYSLDCWLHLTIEKYNVLFIQIFITILIIFISVIIQNRSSTIISKRTYTIKDKFYMSVFLKIYKN